MSVRASGNPGSARRATRVALVLGLLTALAGPLAPLTAAADGLTVTTPFPSIVAEPGSTASFDADDRRPDGAPGQPRGRGRPDGWTARFRGGGLTIDGAYVTPGDPAEVDARRRDPRRRRGRQHEPARRRDRRRRRGHPAADDPRRGRGRGRRDADLGLPRAPGRQRLDVHLQRDAPQRHRRRTRRSRCTRRARTAGPSAPSRRPGAGDDAHGRAGATGDITVTADPSVDAGPAPTRSRSRDRRRQGRDPRARGHHHRQLHARRSTPDQVLSTTANAGSADGLRARASPTPARRRSPASPSARARRPAGRSSSSPRRRHGRPRHAVPVTATITPSSDAITGDYDVDDDRQGRRGLRRRDDPGQGRDPRLLVDRRGRADRRSCSPACTGSSGRTGGGRPMTDERTPPSDGRRGASRRTRRRPVAMARPADRAPRPRRRRRPATAATRAATSRRSRASGGA